MEFGCIVRVVIADAGNFSEKSKLALVSIPGEERLEVAAQMTSP